MEEKQFLDLAGLGEYTEFIKALINGKIFIGTYEEYNAANTAGNIQNNCIVILTDDNTSGSGSAGSSTSTSSLLGTGVLGYMILG